MTRYRFVVMIGGLLMTTLASAQQGAAETQAADRQRVNIERLPPGQRTASQHAQLAQIYQRAGRVDEAAQENDRALQQRGDDVDMLLMRGDIQRQRKQWRQALETFDRVAQLQPQQADVQLRRGQALIALGRDKEADAAFARYRALQSVKGRTP